MAANNAPFLSTTPTLKGRPLGGSDQEAENLLLVEGDGKGWGSEASLVFSAKTPILLLHSHSN